MKILLASAYFYPASRGGTELYVYNLAKGLADLSQEVAVLTVGDGDSYVYEGIPVFTLKSAADFTHSEVTGRKPADNMPGFRKILREFAPDVFHLHTLTPEMNHFHLQESRKLGIPPVVTLHVPGYTCLRGDLLYMGKEPCDGRMIAQRCMSCYLQSKDTGTLEKSLKMMADPLLNALPVLHRFSAFANKRFLFEEIERSARMTVVVSGWQKEIYLLNGFPESKIRVCPQGIDPQWILEKKAGREGPLVIGFSGRVVWEKGLHHLLSVVKRFHPGEVQLLIAGIRPRDEDVYYREMRSASAGVKHIHWLEELSSAEMPGFIDRLDVLAIPSLMYETGPYVLLEAFARKVPVIGFDMGGLAERVQDGVNGMLVSVGDEEGFYQKIKVMTEDRQRVQHLSENIGSPYTAGMMAARMKQIYEEVTQ